MVPLTSGFRRSAKSHNTEISVLADWMEASALFSSEARISGAEMVDTLVSEEIYDSQDFCWEAVDNGLAELRRRSKLNPGFSLSVVSRRVDRVVPTWKDAPAHAFLLLLTLAQRYDKWRKVMPIDYLKQGELFEELTKESLANQLPDWVISPTGWSRANPTTLPQLVAQIAGELGEVQGNVGEWTDPAAKEAGLDLLCYRPFADAQVGIPLLMLQCASGDWNQPGKIKTPDLELWIKLVQFASKPKKAFATHFSFSKKEFRMVAGKVDGILLDRYRLLGHKPESDWVSTRLRKGLLAWVGRRATKLGNLSA